VVTVFADLIVAAFLALLLIQSVLFWELSHTVRSIALEIPLSFVSGSLVAMALLMLFYLGDGMLQRYRAFRIGGPLSAETAGASVDEVMT
jgi:TRAP-type C4-dicarboxylate transport system permease small subunit